VDVQATLTEFTAAACAASIVCYQNRSELSAEGRKQALIVCGGGALNGHLMRRLQAMLPQSAVSASDVWGLPPLEVEAAAFAWLARKAVRRETGSLKSVTGAQGARVLGAVYPA
jgi:anhydro-N-acetylmuramic acid kinase